jgi:hypothetical protein
MNNQYVIPLFVAGSLLLTLFAFFLIAYLLVQKNKQNQYQLEKTQMIFDHENSILRTKIEEQENTMDQISKELHDNIKSVLGFAQMSMYNIARMAKDDEQAVLIDKTNKIIGDVIDNLHNISHSLNSNFVRNIGLVDSITKEIEHVQLSKKLNCNLEIIGEPFSMSSEKEVHIFRIAQEVIQNCIKHAKATNLNFVLDFKPDLFTMKISDNGKGFDKNKVYTMKGLGFLNMFQRARFVHGSLEVESAPSEGSTIILTLNPNTNGINN